MDALDLERRLEPIVLWTGRGALLLSLPPGLAQRATFACLWLGSAVLLGPATEEQTHDG